MEDNADWQRITQVPSGPQTDHTYAGMCQETGYFLHFNTSAGNLDDRALLESRFFYPKRGFQCLQFYYFNSGSEGDQLNILVKEYTEENPNGTLRLVETVQGMKQVFPLFISFSSRSHWVVFEGVKGSTASNGGFSIDDINLSETVCPHHVWHIRNFTDLLNSSPLGSGGRLYSPPFYTPEGYAFEISLYVNGSATPFNLAMYVSLISGANDNLLQWPCAWQQVTVALLDQHPDIRERMTNVRSITTDPTYIQESSKENFWDKPDKVGTNAYFPNGTHYMRGPGYGTSAFLTHQRLKMRDFIKDDGIFILITTEGCPSGRKNAV
ncbi:hypothetical protein JRQ81_012687 [Phrynocephalus forsythii]|uniref:Meprin A subunit beta n=1 Tax=Phrynocephalus forsythii TaxID=171643 RepID=A0A9Q0Y1L6_9SAUR|nr:hypothetical protein JRQ81_012687 [Phrynocephalus forsythii]